MRKIYFFVPTSIYTYVYVYYILITADHNDVATRVALYSYVLFVFQLWNIARIPLYGNDSRSYLHTNIILFSLWAAPFMTCYLSPAILPTDHVPTRRRCIRIFRVFYTHRVGHFSYIFTVIKFAEQLSSNIVIAGICVHASEVICNS